MIYFHFSTSLHRKHTTERSLVIVNNFIFNYFHTHFCPSVLKSTTDNLKDNKCFITIYHYVKLGAFTRACRHKCRGNLCEISREIVRIILINKRNAAHFLVKFLIHVHVFLFIKLRFSNFQSSSWYFK